MNVYSVYIYSNFANKQNLTFKYDRKFCDSCIRYSIR